MSYHSHHSHSHHGQAPNSSAISSTYPSLNYSAGAKWIKNLTQDRLGQFNGGHFGDVNLGAVLFTRKEDSKEFVELSVWSAPGLTKPSFAEAMKQEFRPAKKGDEFGPSCSSSTNHWWKVTLNIPPKEFAQYERVQFEFDPGCEAMIFDTDGTPVHGITGGFGGDRRVEYILPAAARKKGVHELVIESSCNGMFGMAGGGIGPPDPNRYFRLEMADIVVPNQDAWRLLWDFTTLRELVDTLPGNTPLQNKALATANAIMNAFSHTDPSSIARARALADGVFGKGWEESGAGVYDGGDGEQTEQVWGIGHCHIDTAWLWPYSVTQQKTARSWATQIDLMERYPEHRFACSQAQQYKWLEEQYPTLFTRLSAQVAAGKFHPIGGAWVEHDANMPSGEALVRQVVFGQRYFAKKFGVRCEVGWLPDSFGLTGALPQILRGAGMKYFFTQKLSWNNINRFPHSTVLCHMTPVDTYTAQATVGDVNRAITNHKNLESSDTSLLVFGNGDGGGGPLPKMLENLRRIRAVGNTHRELPRVSMGRSSAGETLPNWHGELYLEFHRGTYTSHGSIKKGNRHSEILLRDVEHVATLASLAGKGYVYPREKINECWEKVLLNQFLPGSAIGMVYDDAEKLYAEVRKDGVEMLDEALDVLLGGKRPGQGQGQVVAYNTTPFARREVVSLPPGAAQMQAEGAGYAVVQCAGAGLAPLEPVPRAMSEAAGFMPVSVYATGTDGNANLVMRNGSVQLTIDKGRIVSLVDVKLGRELISKGATGGLVIFEDRPNFWDAWDVEIHHLEKPTPLTFSRLSIVRRGPLRAAVLAEVEYQGSKIAVTISLDAVTASTASESRSLIRFDAHVDWHQRHEFLKFELPLDIHSDNATYETQFGHVQRPTHKNTTWDAAKFEVCGHKYADLSEYGYGVAILSESKYGFGCQGNVLRMSLLRAATEPDADQDQGEHTFSWAVMPHKGHFLESDVPVAAYIFNSPLRMRALGAGVSAHALQSAPTYSPFAIRGAPNVFLETIKRGEDDTADALGTGAGGTIVLRLAQLRVAGGLGVERAYVTNLLEEAAEDRELNMLRVEGTRGSELGIDLAFRGFEVKTVKLVLGSGKVAKKGVRARVELV
ncbi:glycoside hydrolase family 38 protein [Mycena latifolia]|nr:glycoside hydrolase family 38 protein [Mycena latifolia]